MRPAENSTKRNVVENLLAEGGRLLVRFDARAVGVAVPSSHAADYALALAFGYNLTPQIPDLEVTDDGISGTLTFRGAAHRCVVPWSALYAAHIEGRPADGICWPSSFPPEVLGSTATVEPRLTAAEEKARKRAHLKLVN